MEALYSNTLPAAELDEDDALVLDPPDEDDVELLLALGSVPPSRSLIFKIFGVPSAAPPVGLEIFTVNDLSYPCDDEFFNGM